MSSVSLCSASDQVTVWQLMTSHSLQADSTQCHSQTALATLQISGLHYLNFRLDQKWRIHTCQSGHNNNTRGTLNNKLTDRIEDVLIRWRYQCHKNHSN